MADSKKISNKGSTKRNQSLLDRYIDENIDHEEPPLKKRRLETVGRESIKLTISNGSRDIQVISPTFMRNTDLVTAPVGTKGNELIRMPSKTDSGFLSPSSTNSFNDLIQSPVDSAYNSYSGKFPLIPQIPLSVGTSSGIVGRESMKLTISNGSGDIQVISPTLTRNTDLFTAPVGTKGNELIRTPSKTDSGFLSPSSTKSLNDLIQSPADSAYNSYSGESPLTPQIPLFVRASSGIGEQSRAIMALLSAPVGTKGNELIRTPSKTDSGFLSPSSTKSLNDLIQSPADSAYNSYSGKSPLTPQIPLSVGASSGIGTDSSELRTQTVQEQRTPLHQEQLESNRLLNFLQTNFSMLKEEMDPNGIADHLYNDGVIDGKTVERIREEKYRAKKCDCLIKAIAQSPNIKQPCTEQKLRKAFEAEKCSFLLDKLGRDDQSPGTSNVRFEKIKVTAKLRLLGKEIEDRIEPKDIIDDLVTTGMLTLLEHDDILSTDYKANRMKCLMAYLMKEPELHFPKFCDAVEKQCPDLGRKLLQKDNAISSLDQKEPKLQIHAKVIISSSQGRIDGTSNDQDQTYVKFNLLDDREMEKMVVDEHKRDTSPGLDEEVMELGFSVDEIQFSSIRINLTKLSPLSQVRFYEKIKESPQFLENWLQNLLSHEHLKAIQSRGLSTVSFEIHIQKPSTGICLCQLMKKNIVTHFSHLEKAMKNVNQILKVFRDFPHFDPETRLFFNDMSSKDGRNVEAFLLKILQMEDIAVCLLQREMINSDQGSLLDGIVDNNTTLDCKSNKITVKSLRKCHSFLQDEIEPRKFCNIDKIQNREEVWDFVMSNAPRRHRIKKFLDFIHKEGQIAVDQFVQSLEAEKNTNILNVLRSVDSSEQLCEKDADRLRDSLLLKFNDIISEVDTHNLRHVFIERKVMKAKDFDALVCKHSTQKSKIASLLKHVLQSKDSNVLVSFMHAMETKGYAELVAKIKKEAESFKPCPRLDMGTKDVIVFRGFCQLKFFTEAERESPLQLELHKRIYRNERTERDSPVQRYSDQSTQGSVSKSESKNSHIKEISALTRGTIGSKQVDKDAYIRNWVAHLHEHTEQPGCSTGNFRMDNEANEECFTHRKRPLNDTDTGDSVKGPNTPPGKYFVNDTDSGIDTISSINGSFLKRNDEAIEKNSYITEDRWGSSSLPTSPSTTITLYEPISPPSSPSAINSFVPSKYYGISLSPQNVNYQNK